MGARAGAAGTADNQRYGVRARCRVVVQYRGSNRIGHAPVAKLPVTVRDRAGGCVSEGHRQGRRSAGWRGAEGGHRRQWRRNNDDQIGLGARAGAAGTGDNQGYGVRARCRVVVQYRGGSRIRDGAVAKLPVTVRDRTGGRIGKGDRQGRHSAGRRGAESGHRGRRRHAVGAILVSADIPPARRRARGAIPVSI